jgi:hypothetical protein
MTSQGYERQELYFMQNWVFLGPNWYPVLGLGFGWVLEKPISGFTLFLYGSWSCDYLWLG